MKKKIKDYKFYLKIHNNKCKIESFQFGEQYMDIIFKGTITSKPHLEFILQSLNIV